jgi:Leucine-rich repeat (LRR) protein
VCSYHDPFLPACPKSDNQTECKILLSFYDAMSKGDGWHAGSKRGWPGSPEQGGTYCQWEGIKCDTEQKQVIEINLSGKGLQGNFSEVSPSIFVLEKIQKIDLSGNTNEATNCTGVFGTLPGDFNQASLTLRTIQLQQNQITGTVQDFDFARLVNLEYLDLHYNILYGLLTDLPSSLSYFSVASNNMSGAIPSSWNRLVNLQTLGLAHNSFVGNITVVGLMKKLKVLYLRDNLFSGLIPRLIAMLSYCVVMDLQNNKFVKIEGAEEGTFCGGLSSPPPPAFKGSACAPVPDYPNQPSDTCCMNGNPLQGVTPACMAQCHPAELNGNDCAAWVTTVRSSPYFAKATPPACQEISHLEDPCSCTGIIGCNGGRIVSVVLRSQGITIDASQDASLALFSGLQHIDYYNNSLRGPVPTWLMMLTSLSYLYLDTNRLTGTIPSQLVKLAGLTGLYLDNNQLNGTIPSQLAELTRLTRLYLHSNQLNGTIPSQLAEMTGLTNLSLHNNRLTGTIPSQLAELTGLNLLYLSNSQLTGTIPSQLAELTGLNYLYLDHNQLTGTIPSQLAELMALSALHLHANRLTGDVPSLPFKQYAVQCCLYYDQRTNRFTCPLPAGAANCKCFDQPGVVCNKPE